jgi:hypothetical protein
MLQCYVLTCGWSVTAFLAPPRRQHPGKGPRSPHPKAGPGKVLTFRYINGSLDEKLKWSILILRWSGGVRVVFSDVVRGDLSLNTTRPSTIFYRLLLI